MTWPGSLTKLLKRLRAKHGAIPFSTNTYQPRPLTQHCGRRRTSNQVTSTRVDFNMVVTSVLTMYATWYQDLDKSHSCIRISMNLQDVKLWGGFALVQLLSYCVCDISTKRLHVGVLVLFLSSTTWSRHVALNSFLGAGHALAMAVHLFLFLHSPWHPK